MSRSFVASTSAILIAACSQTPTGKEPSADDLACSKDEECVTSTRSAEDCCSECEPRVMNQGALDRLNETCADKRGGPPDCPSLDCPKE
jgi:hypothetical protein